MKLLKERGETYGDFRELARVKLAIVHAMRMHARTYTEAYIIEGLDMIATKLARIANGDPMHVDSWRDIAGYATLVADLLEKEQ